jgi:serine/threonine-protein kinase
MLRTVGARGFSPSRFRFERQILATLDHPRIARLLDGGEAADGRPYLVMEYVEGWPIDDYCDRHRLSVEARIELFLRVCAVVAHAHRHLLVHRDIKPANVLVTPEGEPKLLDFGTAKLLDAAAFPATVELTRTGARWLTPVYASPEQVAGEPTTVASDEFSLGVLLYRLLSGRLPYPSRHLSARGAAVYDDPPPRLSTAIVDDAAAPGEPLAIAEARGLTPELLRRRLAGDLDHIVERALRKEPEQRYGAVDRLADDLRRHLSGLPVEARGASRTYRLRRWMARHRAAVAVTLILLLSLFAFVGVMAWETERVAQERDRARRERDKAAQVAEFLQRLFEVADPGQSLGETITAREILEQGAARLERELADQPEIQASLLTTVGKVFRGLGLYEQAEAKLRLALEVRRAALGAEDPAVAESLAVLAQTLVDAGEGRRAEEVARESLTLHRRLFGERHPGVARALVTLASAEQLYGAYPWARTHFSEAQAIYERLGLVTEIDYADVLNGLGMLAQEAGDLERAETSFRQAAEMYRRKLGPEHPWHLVALSNLASVLGQAGDEEAVPQFHRLLDLLERVYGPDHPRVAGVFQNLGAVHKMRGELTLAEQAFQRALEILRSAPEGEGDREGNPAYGMALHGLGLVQQSRGDPRAEATLLEALAVRRRSQGAHHPEIGYTLISLCLLYLDRREPATAETFCREASKLWGGAYPATDWRPALAASRLGASLLGQGRLDEAGPLLRTGLAGLLAARGSEDPWAIQARRWLQQLEALHPAGG